MKKMKIKKLVKEKKLKMKIKKLEKEMKRKNQ
jgi:hypothetical protein